MFVVGRTRVTKGKAHAFCMSFFCYINYIHRINRYLGYKKRRNGMFHFVFLDTCICRLVHRCDFVDEAENIFFSAALNASDVIE